jgi:3-methyladenine DNA glycosylase/8-oxoguanine DNA glycosylase
MKGTSIKPAARFTTEIPFSNLESIAKSHGWVNLSPFIWDEENKKILRFEIINSKQVKLILAQGNKKITCFCYSSSALSPAEKKQLREKFLYMMGSEIELGGFINLAKILDPQIYDFASKGGARFLRATSLFEDVVKTLFTTNASWQFTQLMCRRLLEECPRQNPSVQDGRFFPALEEISAMPVSALEKRCKLGYRAPYLKNVARSFVENGSFSGWRTTEILNCLKDVKGLGEYSINHIGMLLGKYDQIPVDSEVRSYFRQVGRPDDKESIYSHYENWHPYQFLAYKLERRISK